FSAAQIAAAEAALAAWASVANITFVRVNDGDGYSNNAAIVFGNYSTGSAGAAAFAYNPSSGDQTVGSAQGDIWINSSLSYNANPVVGDYGQQVLLHEIGHALGLNHPADYNAGNGVSIEYGTHATYYSDSRMFTSMSYFSASNTGGITSLYASLPELHDIAAIQRLYGANITTRTGDTIYGFNSNTGLPEYIIALATEAAIFTVWDGGGVDTLDFSGYSHQQRDRSASRVVLKRWPYIQRRKWSRDLQHIDCARGRY
ncbi:MAG: M57 family metalloprotease, partial [Terricaulis sp.]